MDGCADAEIVAVYVFGANTGNQFFPLYEYSKYPGTPDALFAAIEVPRGSPLRVSLVLASHIDPFQYTEIARRPAAAPTHTEAPLAPVDAFHVTPSYDHFRPHTASYPPATHIPTPKPSLP